MSVVEGATVAPADSITAADEKWTEARVRALLAARHPTDRGEWAFFSGLRNSTGYGAPGRESYFDAFALHCWPSTGFTRIAYEIKVARSDWLREVRDPSKRRSGLDLSHQFFFVAPTGVVKRDEVPEACGFLEADAGGLKTRKAAPHREAEAMPMAFIASLLRAEKERDKGLDLRGLRCFRYAGRELTAEELLDVAEAEKGRWLQARIDNEARRRTDEERTTSPEGRLARAVRDVMGRRWSRGGGWGVPSADEFKKWYAALMGGPTPELGHALAAARNLVEDLTRLQQGGQDSR